MGFIQGFILGIILTIATLVICAKPIAKFAAKRSMQSLMVGLQGQVNEFVESIPIETNPNKILEDNKNVKTKK